MTQTIKRDIYGLTLTHKGLVFRPQHTAASKSAMPEVDTLRDSVCYERDDVDVRLQRTLEVITLVVSKDNHTELWFCHGGVLAGLTLWAFTPHTGQGACPPKVRARARSVQPVAPIGLNPLLAGLVGVTVSGGGY